MASSSVPSSALAPPSPPDTTSDAPATLATAAPTSEPSVATAATTPPAESLSVIPRPVPAAPPKRILVAGGAGFIGIHLCARLLTLGHEVLCLDNLFTSQKLGVQQLQRRFGDAFEFVRHDVTLPYYCEVDEVYNLACPASPVHYQYNAIKTTKVSFLGALHLLGLAKRVKARIFQASTSEVYGDPEVSPQREDYLGHVSCTGVRACYDEGKRVAETLFFEYHRMHNVDIRVARIFNTYGPGMHPYDGRVVSNFIMQALANEDITIYGAGQQTRSFCFVDDLVDAIVRFMACTTLVGPLNLGNPHEMTILDLARAVIRLTGSKSRLVFHSLPNNDPKLRQPDISLAKEHLDWTPRVGIEEGLKRTIAYFRTLDLSKYKRPTNHTAHRSSEQINQKTAATTAGMTAPSSH
ncbi:hypothetical protein PybrP1_004491 [[Pythium] brassicae (nom. inval.)]|nr:hypothetical protein PybrP1_004491 [[Pythium] brassicae (nom. inval.)]